jgi:membrane protein
LFNLVSELSLPFLGNLSFADLQAWTLIASLFSWVIPFVLFLGLYRWVPNTKVTWQAALFSAMVITLLLRFTSNGFNWYLSSGLTNYELVYGSLSAIVILLFWIYINSLIIFFGANLCAAINQYVQVDDTSMN